MIIVQYIESITNIHWKRLVNGKAIFAGTWFYFDSNVSECYLSDEVGIVPLLLGMIFHCIMVTGRAHSVPQLGRKSLAILLKLQYSKGISLSHLQAELLTVFLQKNLYM